jgi:hypothetical protein
MTRVLGIVTSSGQTVARVSALADVIEVKPRSATTDALNDMNSPWKFNGSIGKHEGMAKTSCWCGDRWLAFVAMRDRNANRLFSDGALSFERREQT